MRKTPVSGPESAITLASCPADIVELAAFRERASDLARLAAGRGIALAGPGAATAHSGRLTLSVRPGRWLLVMPPEAPGVSAALCRELCEGSAAAVDLSSALAAFLLAGPAVSEMLARACRLDLETRAFPAGRAAATIMVQAPAILVQLTAGTLLLTPTTTARHLHEWLVETSRPFGLALARDATVSALCGETPT